MKLKDGITGAQLEKTFITRTNRNGERGLPWWRSLVAGKKPVNSPSREMEKWAEVT